MTAPTLDFAAATEAIWDSIVLGAGPAGALASRELARAGARVLLVEKKPWPRAKVCGACLNGQALAVLRSVGLGGLVAAHGGIALDDVQIRCQDRTARLALAAGMALSRERFDDALVQEAVAAGVQFLPETQARVESVSDQARCVSLRRGGATVEAAARVVLVAAGLGNACLPHDAGTRTEVVAGARIGAGCIVGEFSAFYQEKTIFMAVGRHGYVGLVKLEDDRLNVAAAFDKDWLREFGSPGWGAATVLARAGFPAVPELPYANWHGTVSLTRRTVPVAGERWFLLGDAAGYVEPFTGEGIASALISGRAVVPLVMRGIACWDVSLPGAWCELHATLVERPQRLCRGLSWLWRHPRLSRHAVGLVARCPWVARPVLVRLGASSPVTKA